MERIKAKLKGGPFDGDQGSIAAAERPETLYAYDCGNPSCPFGSVHWTTDAIEGQRLGAEIYEHSEEESTDQHEIYVYADLTVDLDNFLGTLVDEPVAA